MPKDNRAPYDYGVHKDNRETDDNSVTNGNGEPAPDINKASKHDGVNGMTENERAVSDNCEPNNEGFHNGNGAHDNKGSPKQFSRNGGQHGKN